MKKEYDKPAIYAERFELAEHISGVCVDNGAQNQRGLSTRFTDAESCLYTSYDGDGNILATYFIDGTVTCANATQPVFDGNDPIECYQGPSGTFAPFSS